MNDMAVWHANLNNSILTMHKIWQIAQESDIFLHNLMVYSTIFKFVILLIWMPRNTDLSIGCHIRKNHNDFFGKIANILYEPII